MTRPGKDKIKKEKKKESDGDKKGPKKKLSKKEKKRLKEEQLREAEAQREKERLEAEALEKKRAEEERRAAEEKAKREMEEQETRKVRLIDSCGYLRGISEARRRQKLAVRREEKWRRYLRCDGLPECSETSATNTYISLWEDPKFNKDIDAVKKRTEEVVAVLNCLQTLLDEPLDLTAEILLKLRDTRDSVRRRQREYLDATTFLLTRKMEREFESVGVHLVLFVSTSPLLGLGLWALLPLPEPHDRTAGDDRPRWECDFREMGVKVQLPREVCDLHMVVRALWEHYDHFSDSCRTWRMKPLPEKPEEDLYTATMAEWAEKLEIEQSQKRAAIEAAAILAAAAAAALLQPDATNDTKGNKQGKSKGKGGKKGKGANSNTKETSKGDKKSSKKGSKKGKKKGGKTAPPNEPDPNPTPKELPKSSSRVYLDREEDRDDAARKELLYEVAPHELNLREYAVVGGVLHVDLLQQPKQPVELEDISFAVLDVPLTLKKFDYCVEYYPEQDVSAEDFGASGEKKPKQTSVIVEQEVDAEGKEEGENSSAVGASENIKRELQSLSQEPLESEELEILRIVSKEIQKELSKQREKESQELIKLEKLRKKKELEGMISVSVTLPADVLWSNHPIVVEWDDASKHWSTKDVYDLKFDEEKNSLSFRTRRFGPKGLAVPRYSNLPYRSWEMRPDPSDANAVAFNLSTTTVTLEFVVRCDGICLSRVEGAPPDVTSGMAGEYHTLEKLMRLLRARALDVFPTPDAACYVDGYPKHRVAEDHLYQCMAAACGTHRFSWSRWNRSAGRRNMVLRMGKCREREDFNTYLVTPLRATLVDVKEESEGFSDAHVLGTAFYPDLHCLIQEQSSANIKQDIEDTPLDLVGYVYELLSNIRVASFS